MDTIEISLRILKELNMMLIEMLIGDINSLVSPCGYTFCNVLEFSKSGNLIVKISYPRYFFGNNAFLITKRSECFEVQKYFAKAIMEHEYWKDIIGELKLLRVDIPFTYYMNTDEEFRSYENLYRIMGLVYNETKPKARPKAFIDMINNSMETVIYSDNGKSDKTSNNKLMIYNQYLNLSQKLDEEVLEDTLETYEDLPYRIRMEVSKRIRLRKSFDNEEFSNLDILGSYFEDYKKYILYYALNKDKIDKLYDERTKELAKILRERRALGNFNYEVFVLQNLDFIYDYEILRRALRIEINNQNTRENSVTRVRKILNGIQQENNIIVMDTYAVLMKMRDAIINYRLMD